MAERGQRQPASMFHDFHEFLIFQADAAVALTYSSVFFNTLCAGPGDVYDESTCVLYNAYVTGS